jgi:hypothetical protein
MIDNEDEEARVHLMWIKIELSSDVLSVNRVPLGAKKAIRNASAKSRGIEETRTSFEL